MSTPVLLDTVRLDVEQEPPAGQLVNRLQNPDGDLGGWGWVTPVAGTTMGTYTGGGYLWFRNGPTTQAAHFLSELTPMVAGEYVGARFELNTAYLAGVRARFEFVNAAGDVIASSAQSVLTTPYAVVQLGGTVAPAGTAYVCLRVDTYSTSAGNLPADAYIVMRRFVLAVATSSAQLGSVRRNLFKSPSVESSTLTYFAVGIGSGHVQSNEQAYIGANSWKFFRAPNAGPGVCTGNLGTFPCEAGVTYSWQLRVRAFNATTPRDFKVTVLGLAGNAITWAGGVVTYVGLDSGDGWVYLSGTFVGPGGATTTCRLQLEPIGNVGPIQAGEAWYVDAIAFEQADAPGTYFDGDTPDAGGVDYAWTGTPHLSDSTATVAGDLPYIPPVSWLSILANAHQLSVERAPLDVSMLTGQLNDADLDPAVSDTIRPGRRCRLTIVGTEEPLFTGVLRRAQVTYDLRTGKAAKRARIELQATDHLTELANVPRADGVATIAELPEVLEGAGVPWNVNGSGNQVPSAVIVATNDSATALDQVVITRDSALGHAWFDRRNVLQVWDEAQLSDVTQATLDEATYTDLNIDYDTDRCINTVEVVFLRTNPDSGETEEVTYGPYVDDDSVREWGARKPSQPFTIQWQDEDPAAIASYAAAILAANAQPSRRVNELTFPIRSAGDLGNVAGSKRALLELLDLVRVVNTETGTDDLLRVRGIVHQLTAKRWTVTLQFSRDGQVATPIYTPSPSGGAGGKTLSELLRPIGEVTMFYGSAAQIPAGWLELNGAAIPAGYDDLVTFLGSSTLPDFNDRVPMGASGSKAVGSAGGSATASDALPNHSHSVGTLNTANTTDSPLTWLTNNTGGNTVPRDPAWKGHNHAVTGSTGNPNSNPNVTVSTIQPYRALRFIIRGR